MHPGAWAPVTQRSVQKVYLLKSRYNHTNFLQKRCAPVTNPDTNVHRTRASTCTTPITLLHRPYLGHLTSEYVQMGSVFCVFCLFLLFCPFLPVDSRLHYALLYALRLLCLFPSLHRAKPWSWRWQNMRRDASGCWERVEMHLGLDEIPGFWCLCSVLGACSVLHFTICRHLVLECAPSACIA